MRTRLYRDSAGDLHVAAYRTSARALCGATLVGREIRTELPSSCTITCKHGCHPFAWPRGRDGRVHAREVSRYLHRGFVFVVAISTIACGGARFEASQQGDAGDDQVVLEGGAGDVVDHPDAGDELLEAAAGDGDANMVADGISSEASADAQPGPDVDAAPACCMMPTAACSYPLASCPIASENHGTWPTSFELYTNPAEYCATTATPPPCLCDYTCACIAKYFTCPGSTPNQSCSSDPLGGIAITCST